MSVLYSGSGSGGGGTPVIPELSSDPVSPTAEQMWVLKTAIVSGGSPIGLLLSLTHSTITGYTYSLSYYTLENTIIRTALI